MSEQEMVLRCLFEDGELYIRVSEKPTAQQLISTIRKNVGDNTARIDTYEDYEGDKVIVRSESDIDEAIMFFYSSKSSSSSSSPDPSCLTVYLASDNRNKIRLPPKGKSTLSSFASTSSTSSTSSTTRRGTTKPHLSVSTSSSLPLSSPVPLHSQLSLGSIGLSGSGNQMAIAGQTLSASAKDYMEFHTHSPAPSPSPSPSSATKPSTPQFLPSSPPSFESYMHGNISGSESDLTLSGNSSGTFTRRHRSSSFDGEEHSFIIPRTSSPNFPTLNVSDSDSSEDVPIYARPRSNSSSSSSSQQIVPLSSSPSEDVRTRSGSVHNNVRLDDLRYRTGYIDGHSPNNYLEFHASGLSSSSSDTLSTLSGGSQGSFGFPGATDSKGHKSKPIHKTEQELSKFQKGERPFDKGGFGSVFLGLLETGELIAVKEIEFQNSDSEIEERLVSVEGEIEIMKQLQHENIVQFLGTKRDGNLIQIFMEYVPGGSIRSILSKFKNLNESIIKSYTRQILLGLEYLHSNRIVHRDIKGANILVDTNGTVKLADFGCTKVLQGLNTKSTIEGKSIIGTPYWMAPEVIRAQGHGRPADIWSLGCTIIEMFTGKPPFSNFKEVASAMFHIGMLKETPELPEAISNDAKDFLTKCLNPDPKARATAQMLLKHPFVTTQASIEAVVREQTIEHVSTINSMRESALVELSFAFLSEELTTKIFTYLDKEDILNVGLVCKKWKNLVRHNDIWGKFLAQKTIRNDKKTFLSDSRCHFEDYKDHNKFVHSWKEKEMEVKSLKGHKRPVLCIDYVDEEMFVTGGADKAIRVYTCASSQKLSLKKKDSSKSKAGKWKSKSISGHNGSVLCIQSLEDRNRIVSGSSDKTIKLWDIKGKRALQTLSHHKDDVLTVVAIKDWLFSGSKDSTIVQTDLTTGKLLASFESHQAPVHSMKLIDPSTLVSVSEDGRICIWDLRSETSLAITHRSDPVTSFNYNEDLEQLVTTTVDGAICFWNINPISRAVLIQPDELGVSQKWTNVYSDFHKTIVTSNQCGSVLIWDNLRHCRSSLFENAHGTSVNCLFADKDRMLTGGSDKLVKLWTSPSFALH